MLGSLARWLRLLGHDTQYFNDIEDGELVKLAKEENRILLTRDTRLMERRPIAKREVRAVLIVADTLDDQLDQLKHDLSLKQEQPPFCTICNKALQPLTIEQVRGKVPAYVSRTQREFKYCAACGRYYWRGTHWRGISARFAALDSTSKRPRESNSNQE